MTEELNAKKEDYQDSKVELQDKTKTPREKEEAGADLITSLRVRDAPADLEVELKMDKSRLIEHQAEQQRQMNTALGKARGAGLKETKEKAEAAKTERDQAQQTLDQQQASFETLGQHNTKSQR